MSFKQADIDGLDDVLKKGVKRVKHKDYEAEFHDPESIMKARSAISRSVSPRSEESTHTVYNPCKGL